MKIEQKLIIEIVGVIAVVASLIFVGLQLMLDRRVAIAQQYSERADYQMSEYRSMMESEVYFRVQAERWERGERPLWWDESSDLARQYNAGKISVEDITMRWLAARLSHVGWDNLYFQYRQGLIEDDVWQIYRNNLKIGLSNDEILRAIISGGRRPVGELAMVLFEELGME